MQHGLYVFLFRTRTSAEDWRPRVRLIMKKFGVKIRSAVRGVGLWGCKTMVPQEGLRRFVLCWNVMTTVHDHARDMVMTTMMERVHLIHGARPSSKRLAWCTS